MTEQDESKTKVPAGAKKPADRKPRAKKAAAPKPEPEPIPEDGPATLAAEVKGEKYEVLVEALDDFELLDDLARLDEGDISRTPSILRRLLGPDDTRRALNSIRDKGTGRVTVLAGQEFVGDLMEALDPNS